MTDGKVELTFWWFIENYEYSWHKRGEILKSPVFTVDELEGASFRMDVYPRGRRDLDKGYIVLNLCREMSDEGPEIVSFKCELSLFANGMCLGSREYKFNFRNVSCKIFPNFDELKDVPHGPLTVRARIWKGEGEVRRVAPICARTRIAVENFSFLHVVENFDTLEPNRKKTIEIRSRSENGSVVSSRLYYTDDSCCEGRMILEITPSDSNRILWKRRISLLDASGNMIAGEKENRLDAKVNDIRKLPLSLTRQVILNKKSDYLPDNKLSLFCECAFLIRQELGEIEQYEHGTLTPSSSLPIWNEENTSAYPSLSEDLKSFYLNQRLTDVELKTKTNSFPAHRSVLCARSPVFEAMMTSDMKEKISGCIQVDDLADDIVQQMLLFLYSDDIENLRWDSATQLYYAGDKYEIFKLKEVCYSFLVRNLTTTNAGELLVLADAHTDGELKKTVEDFILEHEKEVFGSKEWEVLMKTNPLLALATMHLKYKRENELNTVRHCNKRKKI